MSRRVSRLVPLFAVLLFGGAARADAPWSPGGTLGFQRGEHTATLLPSGQLVIIGGRDGYVAAPPDQERNIELYEPSKGAPRFDGVITMVVYHAAPLHPDGRLFVVGGISPLGIQCNGFTRVYDPTVGTWGFAAPLNSPRCFHGAVPLPDQTILVTGGADSGGEPIPFMEAYDPAQDVWRSAGRLADPRFGHVTVLFPNGRVLVAGGAQGGAGALASAEIYNPATRSWSQVASMARPRRSAQAALLTDGRVLVTGGLGPEITSVPEAEIYTPATNVWAAAGTVSGGGPGATLTALRNGKALLAGGQIDPDEQSGRRDALLYDPAANAWTTLPSMAYARTSHTATLMPDGRVVVAGGIDRGRGVPSIEIYSPTCTSAASCGTGFCVDGFCCNEACTSPCFACSSAKKSLGTDGVCGPVAQGTDPDSECPLEPEASCGGTGFCNGAGACTLHPQGTVCTPPACSGSVRNRGSTCTGSGQCVARGVEDCTPYECAAGACRSTCTTDDQCGPAGYCAGSVCTGKKPVGVSCRTDAECFTGACADGVCCEQACVTGPCQACSLARGASAEGTCTVLTGRCDDGDRCTIGERCEQGACGGGTALDCGPEDACHERACDPSTGCIAKPLPDGERCDDHSECTREDACVAGNCKGEPLNLCPAPGPCEELALCDTADGACVTVKRPDGAACDDVDPCTVSDACTGGVCAGVPRECLGDECHDAGSCGADGRCSRPPLPDGTRCSAGACMGGICTAAALPADAGVPPLAPDAGAPAAPRGSDDGCGCRTVASGVGSRSAWLAVAIAAQALARRRDRRKRGLP